MAGTRVPTDYSRHPNGLPVEEPMGDDFQNPFMVFIGNTTNLVGDLSLRS